MSVVLYLANLRHYIDFCNRFVYDKGGSVPSAAVILVSRVFSVFFSGFRARFRPLLSIVRGARPAFQRRGGLHVPCGGFLWPGWLLYLFGCHSAC